MLYFGQLFHSGLIDVRCGFNIDMPTPRLELFMAGCCFHCPAEKNRAPNQTAWRYDIAALQLDYVHGIH